MRLEGGEGERRLVGRHRHPGDGVDGPAAVLGDGGRGGPNVRSIVTGDRVLFDPEDRSEVELHGREYVLLRERDVHAVAASRVEPDATGLYL